MPEMGRSSIFRHHGFQVDEAYDARYNDLMPGTDGPWPHGVSKTGDSVDLRVVPSRPRECVVYISDMSAGWAALRYPDAGEGVAMAWDAQIFPNLWYWTQIGCPGFPWYGRGRIVALEPATSWPSDGLAAAIDRGQAHEIPGGGTVTAWLTVTLLDSASAPVVGVDRDGTVNR